jgi:hypothetical protein
MGAVHVNQIVKEQVGPEGFEPSPRRLRAGNAAANTSVPVIKSVVVLRREDRQWAGRRSNPRLLVFSQALSHLSYRPNKKARRLVTPGWVVRGRRKGPSITGAACAQVDRTPVDRRNHPRTLAVWSDRSMVGACKSASLSLETGRNPAA